MLKSSPNYVWHLFFFLKYSSAASAAEDDPVTQLLMEVLKNDRLRKWEKERKLYAERCVLSAARLIAPAVEASLTEGYHWVTEEIRASKHAPLAHALEVRLFLGSLCNIIYHYMHADHMHFITFLLCRSARLSFF